MGFEESPNQDLIDLRVFVDERVTEGNQSAVFRDALGRFRIALGKLVYGLSNPCTGLERVSQRCLTPAGSVLGYEVGVFHQLFARKLLTNK